MPKPKKPRADKIELERRVQSIQGWIIDGNPSTIIVQHIINNGWSTSTRHAERLLKIARERWVEYEDKNVERQRLLKIQQLENRMRGMKPEFKNTPLGMNTLLKYDKEIIKLRGLAAPIKLEHSGVDGQPIQVENKSNIDYNLLSTDVLKAIMNARKPANI